MRTTGKKREIRNAFLRQGLHTTPRTVVNTLAQQGIHVDEEFVRQVRFEMLNNVTKTTVARVPRPVTLPAMWRRPDGFPGRRVR
jgi:hypothetical protein